MIMSEDIFKEIDKEIRKCSQRGKFKIASMLTQKCNCSPDEILEEVKKISIKYH